MEQPTVKREGETWTLAWEENGLSMRAQFLADEDNGFWIELHVFGTGANPFHIYRGRLNCLAPDSKSKLAATLTRKINKVQWDAMLETMSERVIQDIRQGNPVISLDQWPKPDAAKELIRNILPVGETTVMFAAGGSGKSYLAMGMSVAVATMKRLPCGITPLLQQKVMYVDWETSPDQQRLRLGSVCEGLGVGLPPIKYTSYFRPLATDIKRLREEVARFDIGMVVVDSLAPACGGDPSDAGNTIDFFNALRGLGPNVTRLVIAHTSKENAQRDSGRGTAFGSIFIENLARSVWEVRRSEDDSDNITVGLFHRKTNEGPQASPIGVRIRFDEPKVIFEWYDLASDPQLASFGSLSFRIRLALKQGSKAVEQLAGELDTPERIVLGTLSKMKGVTRLKGSGSLSVWGLAEPNQGKLT
jgi:hypothetical protein